MEGLKKSKQFSIFKNLNWSYQMFAGTVWVKLYKAVSRWLLEGEEEGNDLVLDSPILLLVSVSSVCAVSDRFSDPSSTRWKFLMFWILDIYQKNF